MFSDNQILDQQTTPASPDTVSSEKSPQDEQQQPPKRKLYENSEYPDPEPDEQGEVEEPVRKKRNSGRTGPTSSAGRMRSAQNALKHGACSRTLVLPMESREGWEILLSRWEDRYQPEEASLEADFVLRTAQHNWLFLRAERQYDEFIIGTGGRPPFQWTPEEIKMHDLMLRYKNTAARNFHRELRALDAHYKTHKIAKPQLEVEETPDPEIVCAPDEEIQADMRAQFTPISEDRTLVPSSPPN